MKALVIGACGQIGTELVDALKKLFGAENILSVDIKDVSENNWRGTRYVKLDAMDGEQLYRLVKETGINWIFHLAAVLSAKGEQNPRQAWKVNMETLWNVLEIAKETPQVERVFWPSSIAVFGPDTPKQNTPQVTIMNPLTVYGITKLAGEKLCEYYKARWQVDVRSLRYPGLLSYTMEPGGGTTDYAIEMCEHAILGKKYTCPLSPDRRLPMMYIQDAIEATLTLMQARRENLRFVSYNIHAFDFTPEELASAIKQRIPTFEVHYNPDFRDDIASQWPETINDEPARTDWGWEPSFDFNTTVDLLLEGLKQKHLTSA